MLSKVHYNNILYATYKIKEYAKDNKFTIIQDNLYDSLLVKCDNCVFLWNYKNNKKYMYFRIKISFNSKIFFKQIDSFDQNNIKESKNIRKNVLCYFKQFEKSQNIIGIGGEYYIYFPFVKYKKYFGLSNHNSIIEDANYNSFFSKNYLVNYDDLTSYPILNNNIDDNYDVVINVVNIHENIIKYICTYNIKNIIIITCKPLNSKIKMLNKYLTFKKVNHVLNINSWITICLFKKK